MATLIEMPKMSDTMETGTLVDWKKKEGDSIEAGDVIAEVETDKATMELEAFESGVLLTDADAAELVYQAKPIATTTPSVTLAQAQEAMIGRMGGLYVLARSPEDVRAAIGEELE